MNFLTRNDSQGHYPASYYAAHTPKLFPFPEAKGQLSCDVCIIGGGFTGLSSALHLAQKGYDVILLEAHRIGFGASGRNGGQICNDMRHPQPVLEKWYGKTQARALWDLAHESVDLVRHLAQLPAINTPVYNGIIHADHKAHLVPKTHAYIEFLKSQYDFHKLHPLSRDAIREIVASDSYHGGMLDLGAGHINPLAFALGLARLIQEIGGKEMRSQKTGVRIFENSTVKRLQERTPALLHTDHAEITAQYVLLCCNGYLDALNQKVAAKIMPMNSFIAATEPLGPDGQEAIIKQNYAVADSKFIINYFRFSDDHRLLFGATESYHNKFPQDIAGNIRKPLGKIFPQLQSVRFDYAWGGTLAITRNRLPHFARLRGNILSSSGYSGQGVAMGTLAGKIMAEAISGQAEKFDIMAQIAPPDFPGGTAWRTPFMRLAMLWYGLKDKF